MKSRILFLEVLLINGKTITHHTYDNTIYKKTYYFVSDFDDDSKKKLYVYKFKNKGTVMTAADFCIFFGSITKDL